MAIRIVGKDPAMFRQVTCKNCSSILEYLPQDLLSLKRRDYTGSTDMIDYIVCSWCRKEIVINIR